MGTKIRDENFPNSDELNRLPCIASDRYLQKIPETLSILRCCVDPNNTNILIIDFSLNGVYLFSPVCYIKRVGLDTSYEDNGVTAPFALGHYANPSIPIQTNCRVFHGQVAFDFGIVIPNYSTATEIEFELQMVGTLPQSFGISFPNQTAKQTYIWQKSILPLPVSLNWVNGNLAVTFDYHGARDCSCNIQCTSPTGVSLDLILCPDKRQEVIINDISLNGNPQNLLVQFGDSLGNYSNLIIQGLLGVTVASPIVSKFDDSKRVEISISRRTLGNELLENVEYQILRYEGSENNYHILKDWSYRNWNFFVDYGVIPGKQYGYAVRYKGKFNDVSNVSSWATVVI